MAAWSSVKGLQVLMMSSALLVEALTDTESYFRINISKTNILERGLLQWLRQKKVLPTATLKVTFFGETGIDTGALRKEFLIGLLNRFCLLVLHKAPGPWFFQ
ncbi:hypothetical protein DPEC_G00042920 [Dallia pectoralis]|uniref:Uncharacterized protein n=1 Tax=Dallia pectoralis TaxID=75939 RepID=A0ACC2H947_DALPE|nr:hypothetical protein DPEC_G00042920 [Dallia pectoralis]